MVNPRDKKETINKFLTSDYILERYIKHLSGGLTVMPNNICNAKCVMCPYPFHQDPKTTMSLETFKKALDSALETGNIGSLQFTPMAGEPLADRTLFDKIAYAKSKFVQVISFSTNGILLGHRDIFKKAVDANITSVHISTPGFDPAYYKSIFGVDKSKELVDGLQKLAEYKRNKPECTTRFELSVLNNLPESEAMKLRGWQLLREYIDDGTLILCGHASVEEMFESYAMSLKDNPKSQVLHVDNYSGSIRDDMLPENWVTKPVNHSTSDIPCWRIFEDLAIIPNGKVRVCSCRYMGTADDELVIGDLASEPMSQIVYGEKHKRLIKDMAAGHWPEVCRKCSMYQAAQFSDAEADLLSDKAKRHCNQPDETFAINSSESLAARARAKLALAEGMKERGEIEGAHGHLHGALSYAVELDRRQPANRKYLGLLKESFMALGNILAAENKKEDAVKHFKAACDVAARRGKFSVKSIISPLLSVLLLSVSIGVSLVAAEIVLRVKNSSMTNYDIEMWRYAKELKQRSPDERLDFVHVKSKSATLQSINIRLNEWGLRGARVDPIPPGGRRILFLGGSIALGWGVAESHTVEAKLEKMLHDAGENVQVLNGGTGNYNADRYVSRFFGELEGLNPTDIVVQYFLRDAEVLSRGNDNVILRNSQLAVTLWTAYHRLLDRSGEDVLIDHYRAAYEPSAAGFQAMSAQLARLADYAKKKNVRLFLAMTPDVHNLVDYKFGFVHEIMKRTAERNGYTYIDLLPAMRGRRPEELFAMPGDPHPNALGHELMAKAIYPIVANLAGKKAAQ